MVLEEFEKRHLRQVRNSAAECTVLLKKDGHFPLKEAGDIAAFGSGVRNTVKGGTGSGEVNSRFSVNIEKGLRRAGFHVTTTEWLNGYDEQMELARALFIKQMKKEARAAHQQVMMYAMGKSMPQPEYDLPLKGDGSTAIYVLSRDSGEGADRQVIPGDVKLTHTEIQNILMLNQSYTNFMLVLNVGGVVDLTPVADVKNILLLSQLGALTGYVLADILLGKSYPSGKLATTWAGWDAYPQVGNFGDKNETFYKEGIYVGYRYFDTVGIKPLFAFGYGLSYTDFSIRNVTVTNQGTKVAVQAQVVNTGAYEGKEVVQVYVSSPSDDLDQPYQVLAGWAKTHRVNPNNKDLVEILFDLKELASYDEIREGYILESGDYVIRVGNSSDNTTPAAVLRLDKTVIVTKTKNCLGTPGFDDFYPERKESMEVLTCPVLTVSASDIETREVDYNPDYPIDERVKKLTDDELVTMNIGAFDPDAKGLSVIGNASFSVPGAAGETSAIGKEQGIKTIVMADGPAGLRIAKDYYEDAQGKHAMQTGMIPESMLIYMGGLSKLALKMLGGKNKVPSDVEVLHQYATAIPIGTAIAQSFNPDMAESLGDLVGDEMERFGVQLWLAPALNIHRSILCGRNFEYYSEDPLVSGRAAAAITRGVQRHAGCGTTIKHYAVNNQETNRSGSNSHVSERAMREIYLKGFGICVRESQPHALMTSYNLLNGTHTSEHRGLIEDILRCEYGYKGIVMTDWVIQMMTEKGAAHRNALSSEVAMAGGDLFMPGCKGDFENLKNALGTGGVSRRQLEINATRTARMADLLGNGRK